MKNPLHYIHTYTLRTKQILGISYDQFLLLVQQAELINQKKLVEVEQNKVRINAPGGGRKPKLTTEESVCLCLFYLRQMPTFEVLGMHFDISKTEANNTFHYWMKIFRIILPSSLLEQVKNQESDFKIVQKLLTEFELIVDSMEQCRERYGDNEEQKKYFFGKKKNQVVSMPEAAEIVDVVVGVKGPTSDISLFRNQQKKFDAEQLFKGDKAYIGGLNRTYLPLIKSLKMEN
jgi:Helix-turn-helix of DDE superfamily endonuclease